MLSKEKSRGRVYDFTNLATNICQGVSPLTQPCY